MGAAWREGGLEGPHTGKGGRGWRDGNLQRLLVPAPPLSEGRVGEKRLRAPQLHPNSQAFCDLVLWCLLGSSTEPCPAPEPLHASPRPSGSPAVASRVAQTLAALCSSKGRESRCPRLALLGGGGGFLPTEGMPLKGVARPHSSSLHGCWEVSLFAFPRTPPQCTAPKVTGSPGRP